LRQRLADDDRPEVLDDRGLLLAVGGELGLEVVEHRDVLVALAVLVLPALEPGRGVETDEDHDQVDALVDKELGGQALLAQRLSPADGTGSVRGRGRARTVGHASRKLAVGPADTNNGAAR